MRIAPHALQVAVLIFCVWVAGSPASAGENMVNLPVHHWVYDALGRLARMGLITESFLTLQPIRRDEAARLVAEALAKRNRFEPGSEWDWTDELLSRLELEFQRELRGETPNVQWRWADPIEFQTTRAGLDGVERQPLENQGGRSVSDGLNTRLTWRGWAQAGNWAALTLEGEVRSHDPDEDLFLTEGSLKSTLFFLDLEIGRDRQWWGPGEHGALILSDNAPPMDMIRISNAHPSRLPWVLSNLGEWKWAIFITRLEHDRDFPRAKLGGVRLVWSPIGWLELGASRTVIFGGEGRPHFTRPIDYLRILVGYGSDNEGSPYLGNDNLGAWDVTVYLPWIHSVMPSVQGAKLYLEYAGEDNCVHEYFRSEVRNLCRIAPLMGLSVSFPRSDLRLEYANNVDDVITWYTHSPYTTGYTFNGFTIGHEMGGNADDLSLSGTFYLTPTTHLLTAIERERVGSGPDRETDFDPCLPPCSVIYAGNIGLKYSLLPSWEAAVEYRYEHAVRPEFVSGESADAHLLMAGFKLYIIP
jgi:hypothetical protein